eukprot:IDg18452t1
MGLEDIHGQDSAFSDKVPPAFDGNCGYMSYRQDVELWMHLTTLPKEKHGAALIGRLSGEAKNAAKMIAMTDIMSSAGAQKILEHLDKSYAASKTDQLDLDLDSFLEFIWSDNQSVDQFVAGFRTRLDKIAELNIDSKFKGHLLLRQAGLDKGARNMIIGSTSGSYEVDKISSALRLMYLHIPNISA